VGGGDPSGAINREGITAYPVNLNRTSKMNGDTLSTDLRGGCDPEPRTGDPLPNEVLFITPLCDLIINAIRYVV
jgi:hypothetical protein